MKVIFLDIDGVLNCQEFYRKRYRKRWLKPITYWFLLRRIVMKLLGLKPKGILLADYTPPKYFYTIKYNCDRLVEETDKLKWKWLAEFCNENNYKIVISSTWRNMFKAEDTVKGWEAVENLYGFHKNTIIGITGRHETRHRGTEIQEFIDENPDIERYAILDDDSDMTDWQLQNCFFHVDGFYGLSPNHLYRIKRYFDRK